MNAFTSKYGPTLMTIGGIGCMVGMAVMAYKAAKKIETVKEAYEEAKESYEDESAWRKDYAVDILKCMLPTVALGAAGGAAIIGSHCIQAGKTSAALAALSATAQAGIEYKEKVKELVGEKKHLKIMDAIAEDRLDREIETSKELPASPEDGILCYDCVSGRYFHSTVENVRRAETEVMKRLVSEMHVSLNDFYELLGLPPIGLGEDLGWHVDGQYPDIVFTSTLKDDVPVLVVNYNVSIAGRW